MPKAVSLPAFDGGVIQQLQNTKHALIADEVAALLRKTRGTVYRWARTGVIPSFRAGGSVLFDPFKLALCLGGES
jgi:excisionase family DNA binding protein